MLLVINMFILGFLSPVWSAVYLTLIIAAYLAAGVDYLEDPGNNRVHKETQN